MEYWNDGILERIYALFSCRLHSALRNLHSTIEAGGDLMLWIMGSPKRAKQYLKFEM